MIFKLNTDDNLNVCTSERLRKFIVSKLTQRFGYTDEGVADGNLGISIDQQKEYIDIHQSARIQMICDEFEDARPRNTPKRSKEKDNGTQVCGEEDPKGKGKEEDPKDKGKEYTNKLSDHGPKLTAMIRKDGMFRSTLGKL